ncbi:putative hydrolase [Lupinus albus]|uniref:Putative hydrolase n=1 Tax=Lupinus albus TaxID=3870 RepID=A0A6A4NA95_LUPAL|nr:putative hydrolase [Lupinus albus]
MKEISTLTAHDPSNLSEKDITGIWLLAWIVNIGHFRDPSHGLFLAWCNSLC